MTRDLRRRTIAAGIGTLAAAALLPRAARAAMAELYDAARKEGTLTWYTAHTDTEGAELYGRTFTQKYPGVTCDVVRATSEVIYQRVLQEAKNSSIQCDVFSSTDAGHHEGLKARHLLAHYVPRNAASVLPAFQDIDPDGDYYCTSAGLVLITYNTSRVKPGEVPRNWPDLLDPKWRNRVAVGHPAFSGYVGIWVVAMRKLYGWDFFEKLAKNGPQIGRSINDTTTMLNSGERLVAAGPTGSTMTSADKGNPLALIYPTDGTVLISSPTSILAGGPHPNAARLFMEFLLSEDSSRLSVATRNESLHAGVSPLAGAKPFTDSKYIRLTTAEIQKGVPDVIELWRDTFGS